MAAQERSPNHKHHLDASLVPLEHALTFRAGVLEGLVKTGQASLNDEDADFIKKLAKELRAIAEELHHW